MNVMMNSPMLANVLVENFTKGGPIMWPILVVSIVALGVVLERVIWYFREKNRRDPATLEKIFGALEAGDFEAAVRDSKDSQDPVIRMIYHGMNHHHSSLEGALQVAAGTEIQKAGRFLTAMDTIITLAPLLGLLGTVTGIMGSFKFIGDADLAVNKVSGGIGEALIATACGLGIAIFTLVPFNLFTAGVARLQFELETAATNVEVLVTAAKNRGYDTQLFRKGDGK